MNDIQVRAAALADALIGTCNGAPDELFEVQGLAEAFDELAFECTECGWWCEIGDMAENEEEDEHVCKECKE